METKLEKIENEITNLIKKNNDRISRKVIRQLFTLLEKKQAIKHRYNYNRVHSEKEEDDMFFCRKNVVYFTCEGFEDLMVLYQGISNDEDEYNYYHYLFWSKNSFNKLRWHMTCYEDDTYIIIKDCKTLSNFKNKMEEKIKELEVCAKRYNLEINEKRVNKLIEKSNDKLNEKNVRQLFTLIEKKQAIKYDYDFDRVHSEREEDGMFFCETNVLSFMEDENVIWMYVGGDGGTIDYPLYWRNNKFKKHYEEDKYGPYTIIKNCKSLTNLKEIVEAQITKMESEE